MGGGADAGVDMALCGALGGGGGGGGGAGMDCALTAFLGRGGGRGGGGGGDTAVVAGAAVAVSLAFAAACLSRTSMSLVPGMLADGSGSFWLLSCPASGGCLACTLRPPSPACAADMAAGNSSRDTRGEGATLSWLSMLDAGKAVMTAAVAPAPACSSFCEEAEAKGEVGIEPSLTCPFA